MRNKNAAFTCNSHFHQIQQNTHSGIVMISGHVCPSHSFRQIHLVPHIFRSNIIQFTNIFTTFLIIYRLTTVLEHTMGLTFGYLCKHKCCHD